MKKKTLYALILLLVTFFLTTSHTNATKKITVQQLQVTQNLIALRIGEKVTINSTVSPKKATNTVLNYKSTNENYVTVSSKGVLKAKSAGLGKRVKIVVSTTDGSHLRDRVWVRILPKIDSNKKMIALTFDDGPNAITTNRIVSTLKKYNAVATFFELGCNLGSSQNKAATRRAYNLGNEIGSHTTNHKVLPRLSAQQISYENSKCASLIKAAIGMTPTLMRPPYGSVSTSVKQNVGMPLILWSVDTLDWKTRNPSITYQRTMSGARDGAIVLMHSIYRQTATAVDSIVPALKAKGYQFVTVSELYKYNKVSLVKGHSYNGIYSH